MGPGKWFARCVVDLPTESNSKRRNDDFTRDRDLLMFPEFAGNNIAGAFTERSRRISPA